MMRRLMWLLVGIGIGSAGMLAAEAMVIRAMPPEMKYRGVQPAPPEPARKPIDLTPTRPMTFDYREGWKDGVAFGPLPAPRGYIVPAPHVTPRAELPHNNVPEPAALALIALPLAWLIWRKA